MTRRGAGGSKVADSAEQAQPVSAPQAARAIAQDASRFLEVYLGSFSGPSYGVWLEGTMLVYESFEPGYRRRQQLRLSPSRAQWRRFWRSMDQIGVWDWDDRYEPGIRFEPGSVVRDGTHWSLTLARGDRAVQSSGDNAGPGAFDLDESRAFTRFCAAVARLIGDREFA